jgi:hypothetical protein
MIVVPGSIAPGFISDDKPFLGVDRSHFSTAYQIAGAVSRFQEGSVNLNERPNQPSSESAFKSRMRCG